MNPGNKVRPPQSMTRAFPEAALRTWSMPPTDNILSPETATARAAGTAGSMVITLAFTNNRSREVGRDMGPRYQKMAR